MKQHSSARSHRHFAAAFTIVELLVVIVIIAILASLTIVGIGEWRTRTAETEVKSDASGLIAGMEEARNRSNGYPILAIGTEFNGSTPTLKGIFVQNSNVKILYAGGSANSYCADLQSRVVPGVRMFIDTSNGNRTPKNGTCDGGESTTPPALDKTIFVFDTSAPGCTGTVQLPVSAPASGGTIDWGDGTTEARTASLQSHTYSTAKTYLVTFDGAISQASYYSAVNATNAKCLTKVNQWGSAASPTKVSFYNASNLVYVAEPPNTVTDMSYMFYKSSIFNQPIGGWDMSNVTNVSSMFYYASVFNQPIKDWNMSKVTAMSAMFYYASAFNQPIGNWNTSLVTNMANVFAYATAFNQPIDSWNTSKVTIMTSMFANASAFNQPLSSWDTSKVTLFYAMFNNASAFNQNISGWNVSASTNSTNFHLNSALTQANCPPPLW